MGVSLSHFHSMHSNFEFQSKNCFYFICVGERPYTCDKCNKSFSQVASLDRHKRTVHQRIRSHACQQCDKRFTTAFGLKQHVIIHTRASKKNSN